MLCWLRKRKLFEYAIGELRSDEVKKVERHLQICPGCRGYVERIQKISSRSSAAEPFLNEVFWRKFDERLDLCLAQEQVPVHKQVRNIKFLPKPLPRFNVGFAVALCVLLIFIASLNKPFNTRTVALEDEEFIETALLVEDASEISLNGDEDAYIEEILLQITLDEA